MNGANGLRGLPKIEESTQEIRIFTQFRTYWKNTNKNTCKKANTHIRSFLSYRKTSQAVL